MTRGTGYAATSVPYNYQSVGSVNLLDPVNVTLTYDGSTLTEFLQDATTGATFSTAYTVDLISAVGGSTANIGFTGVTGAGASLQQVGNFSYVVPEPSLLLAGIAALAVLQFRHSRGSKRTTAS